MNLKTGEEEEEEEEEEVEPFDENELTKRHIPYNLFTNTANVPKVGQRIERDEFVKSFSQHDMTFTEILDVFRIADLDKDGSLDIDEWNAFYVYFIKPYEQCIDNKLSNDYSLDLTKLKCVINDK
jgi:hypothetical protein